MRKMSRLAVFGLVLFAAAGLTLIGRGSAEGDGLTIASPQLVTSLSLSQTSSQIFQYRFESGYPTSPWISGAVGSTYGSTGSGDVDNDGAVEVYAVGNKLARTVPINKKTTYYYYTQDLVIYESGALPGTTATRTIYDIKGSGIEGARTGVHACVVADVDDDSYQELVVQYGSGLAVYQLAGEVFTREWETPATFEYTLNGLAVGDVDGLLGDEIVASTLVSGAPVIFKFNGAGFEYGPGQICTTFSKGSSSVNITDPGVGDLDNDGAKEIVSGGNNYRVMVWDYDQGEYKLRFTSPSLGYLSFASVGDVNGDGDNEIIAANMGNMGKPPYIWIYAFDGSKYILKSKTPIAYSGIAGVEIGRLDGDAKDEVVIPLAGLIKFYRFVGENLTSGVFSEYASVTGSPFEIR